jgi:hypothetical protein
MFNSGFRRPRCGAALPGINPGEGEKNMGNRGTVIFTDGEHNFSPAVYLHWNGGPDSIYSFLEELDRRLIRADQDYEAARFIQLVGEFFDQHCISGLSLGVSNGPVSDSLEDLRLVKTDKGGNGIYLVCRKNGKRKVRRFVEHSRRLPHKGGYTYTFYLSELPQSKVKKEFKDWKTCDSRQNFREFFARLTEGKPIEQN